MGVRAALVAGVRATFKVFADGVKNVDYLVDNSDGWDEGTTSVNPVDVLMTSFTKEDKDNLPFGDIIQSTDVQCLIPGDDLPVPVKKGDIVREYTNEEKTEYVDYDVVDMNTDLYKVLYVLLLRTSK